MGGFGIRLNNAAGVYCSKIVSILYKLQIWWKHANFSGLRFIALSYRCCKGWEKSLPCSLFDKLILSEYFQHINICRNWILMQVHTWNEVNELKSLIKTTVLVIVQFSPENWIYWAYRTPVEVQTGFEIFGPFWNESGPNQPIWLLANRRPRSQSQHNSFLSFPLAVARNPPMLLSSLLRRRMGAPPVFFFPVQRRVGDVR